MQDKSFSQIEQLAMLKDMTARTGILHEAQVLQLKLWPLVAAPHAISSKCLISMDKKTVKFELITQDKAPKDFEERLKALDTSIKENLLGKDWKVLVFTGKTRIYPKRKVKNVKSNRSTKKSKHKRS